MTQKRSAIWHCFLDGKIDRANFKAAMLEAYSHPNANKWQQLITNQLLYLGVLLVGVGVIFFMAFNWDALTPSQRLIQYRVRDGRAKLASNAFFFQEGRAEEFERARYGECRVNQAGKLLLSNMIDIGFKRI